jgi:hypothetical protein
MLHGQRHEQNAEPVAEPATGAEGEPDGGFDLLKLMVTVTAEAFLLRTTLSYLCDLSRRILLALRWETRPLQTAGHSLVTRRTWRADIALIALSSSDQVTRRR